MNKGNENTNNSKPMAYDTLLVTVCDKCLQASCWQGVFMCDDSQNAGTVEKTKYELKKLNLEHPSYWGEGE